LALDFVIKPMMILYDSKIFQLQKYGGISRYFVNLIQRVAREEQVVVSASLYVNNYLAELPPGLVKGVKLAWSPPGSGRVLEWVGRAVDRVVIAKSSPDVLHETYYSRQAVAPASIPSVLTVYDMIHERYANMFPRRVDIARRKAAAVSRASHVICISENTRRDLLEFYDVDPNKVSVVHLGYDVLNAGMDSGERASTLSKSLPYLLYVGERAFYKNFQTFLRAYAGSVWLRKNFRIICFGGGGFQADELELIRELDIKPGQIEQVGGGDNMLAVHYQNAAAFVYPSLYEGFGIPPLEAMALGCPVVCSNTSSIPEVVGDAGEYFDPQHIESIRASLESVLQSSERRAELIRKGFKKCAEYSWDRCASETLEIYRGLVR
jgi:glycosyltransferase involved in cell wall biosynthesis